MTIPLSQEKSALIDDEDFDLISGRKWHAQLQKTGSYIAAGGWGKNRVLMHRLIMKTPKGVDVDHKNGDTLDNRKCNLRNVSRSENMLNTNGHKGSRLGVKGVYAHGKKYRWQAMINGKLFIKGGFLTTWEAELDRVYFLELKIGKSYSEICPRSSVSSL